MSTFLQGASLLGRPSQITTESVTRDIAARIESALDSWPHWACNFTARPYVLKRLSGGYTNMTFLIGDAKNMGDVKTKTVMRLNSIFSHKLGIDRRREFHILKALEAIDTSEESGVQQSAERVSIAPHVLYWSSAMDFVVFEYIEGRTWTLKDFASPSQRRKLLQTVAKFQHAYQCYQIQVDHLSSCNLESVGENHDYSRDIIFCYSEQLEKYWRHLCDKKPGFARQRRSSYLAFYRRLRVFQLLHLPRVLAHHDLVPGNIIESNHGLRIIDWEYAGLGWKGLDNAFIQQQCPGPMRVRQHSILNELLYWLELLWWEVR